MLGAVLSGFILSFFAPFAHRLLKNASGWFLALLPLGLAVYFAGHIRLVAGGEGLIFSYNWVPSLSVNLSFYLDGLSLLFAVIITGIGAVVIVYASAYLEGHPQLGRLYAYLLAFMASMIGVVLADNLVTIFIFWELTGLCSYLLIGFEHERKEAREAALQALLVTGTGGLAMLAGFLLLGEASGSYEVHEILSRGDIVRSHPQYAVIFILILAGAWTKSAQFPTHFWLPNAMEAPTPVSTYLHSATMVKAGVYLLARLSPVLGETALWHTVLTVGGAATMLTAVLLSITKTDLKRILAYSTISLLGVLVFLLGLGTRAAVEAAIAYLIIHCLYKAALFLVAGIVDHGVGTRDITKLGGLGRLMPITAASALLAGLSMAGLPPLFGFIGKELLYGATLEAPLAASLLTVAALLTNVFMVVAAGMIGLAPFFGEPYSGDRHAHRPAFGMWIGPALLAGLGGLMGLMAAPLGGSVISPAVAAVLNEPAHVELELLHGLTWQLFLSGVTFVLGIVAFMKRKVLAKAVSRLDIGPRFGPDAMYHKSLDAVKAFAHVQTRILQSGRMHYYLLIIIVTTIVLAGYTLLDIDAFTGPLGLADVRFHEGVVCAVVLAAAGMAVRAKTQLIAVSALGAVGVGVVLIYILFGAPDLAMTQFSIDTLTVILLVLVLHRLPPYETYSKRGERFRDGIVAVAAGILMTVLTLIAVSRTPDKALSRYFAENSYLLAKGKNIVNVILVDFRALDTLGEITVLSIAAIGVYSLLKLKPEKG